MHRRIFLTTSTRRTTHLCPARQTAGSVYGAEQEHVMKFFHSLKTVRFTALIFLLALIISASISATPGAVSQAFRSHHQRNRQRRRDRNLLEPGRRSELLYRRLGQLDRREAAVRRGTRLAAPVQLHHRAGQRDQPHGERTGRWRRPLRDHPGNGRCGQWRPLWRWMVAVLGVVVPCPAGPGSMERAFVP